MDQAMIGTRNAPQSQGEWAGYSPEHALLKQFAMAGPARRAGLMAQAVRAMPQPDPAPPEHLSACSPTAIDWLMKVGRSPTTQELLRDWSLTLIARRKRVPHAALPQVLNMIKFAPWWAPYMLPLVGERGRWLIARTEAYAKLRDPLAESDRGLSPLTPTEINPKNTTLIDLHKQMMERLAYE
jgi:hypothetical protein